MSGRDGKTEKATGKRKGDARKKGQVARSHDVNSAVGLIVVFAVLVIGGLHILAELENMLASSLANSGHTANVTPSAIEPMMLNAMETFAIMIAPIVCAAAIAGILTSVAQVGFKWSSQALRPKLSSLNPAHGLKRLFGPSGLVETGKALVKLVAIGGIAFLGVWSQMSNLGSLVGDPPAQILSEIGHRVESLAWQVLVVLSVLAVGDMLWQRRKLAKSLMMSKEEVKQEGRQTDIAPEVRGAIRKRQFQLARRRMLAEVPTADVVIVNPTHFAVALRYDGNLAAPEVVAKGVDHIAAAIRAAADEHGVPQIENAPLARTLYREVQLGEMIPEALFVAVAEVLAYVYRTAKGRARARRRTPAKPVAATR